MSDTSESKSATIEAWEPLFGWKFLIPPGDRRSFRDTPHQGASGMFAVVVAGTEEAARAALVRACQHYGEDPRWVEIADVRRLDIVEGAVLIQGAIS